MFIDQGIRYGKNRRVTNISTTNCEFDIIYVVWFSGRYNQTEIKSIIKNSFLKLKLLLQIDFFSLDFSELT